MQDRYAFDIGDFSKFGLLRALAPAGRIGVLWYLNEHLSPKERANGDGKHLQHIDASDRRYGEFGQCDPALQLLMASRKSDPRRAANVECCLGVDGAVFVRDPIPRTGDGEARKQWFNAVSAKAAHCALLCCDPDNGVAMAGSDAERRASAKHVLLREVEQLAQQGHSLVLYHSFGRQFDHNTQAAHLQAVLSAALGLQVKVLRWHSVSPRAYAIAMQPGHQPQLDVCIQALIASQWGKGGHFSVAAS